MRLLLEVVHGLQGTTARVTSRTEEKAVDRYMVFGVRSAILGELLRPSGSPLEWRRQRQRHQ